MCHRAIYLYWVYSTFHLICRIFEKPSKPKGQNAWRSMLSHTAWQNYATSRLLRQLVVFRMSRKVLLRFQEVHYLQAKMRGFKQRGDVLYICVFTMIANLVPYIHGLLVVSFDTSCETRSIVFSSALMFLSAFTALSLGFRFCFASCFNV